MTKVATVVGGGPAGLMAAEVLATAGLSVRVFDHMASFGRKFLVAGRGGLNLTHSRPLEELLERYGTQRPALEAAIRSFGPDELRAWCAELGETTFVGSSGRVFPASFRATPLLRAWLQRLADTGVVFEPRHRWLGWAEDPSGHPDPSRPRFGRVDGTTVEVPSDVTVLALGGASWPRTGSDGGWASTLTAAGVRVEPFRPANCAFVVDWSPQFVERFAGTPLKNVAVGADGAWVRGDAVITTSGIEGGPVYDRSAALRDAIERDGRAVLYLDLQPDLTTERLTQRLERRRPKESTTTWIRRSIGLAPVAVAVLREATGNQLPNQGGDLARLVKSVPLGVERTMPIERAISTAGGIAMTEIDETFMLRRLLGVFVAGEMLDWEAPTGGYLLQATFSTAVAAARGAVERVGATTVEVRGPAEVGAEPPAPVTSTVMSTVTSAGHRRG